MVETSLCPRCSTAVPSDQAFCGRCGAPLATDPSLVSTDEGRLQGDPAADGAAAARPRGKASPSAEAQSVAADRLAAALGFATLVEPANSTAGPTAGTSPVATAGTTAGPTAGPTAVADPNTTVIGLQPSGVSATRAAGSRANVTLSAQPATSTPDRAPAADPAPAAKLAPARPAPEAPQLASSREPAPSATGPEVHTTPQRKESVQELVAFGLVAAGAVVGIASLFLPWGNATDGAGIAIDALHSGPNEWGWSMSVAIPLLLLSAVMLGAAYGSDRAKERIPNLAGVVGQVTDLILPMILGGLYLGVVVMAATYPWGFGIGVAVMFVAAGLLIGGAVVNLFLPPKAEPDSH